MKPLYPSCANIGMRAKWPERSAKEKVFRALIHVPVGAFNVFLAYVGWAYGLIFFGAFMVYEVTEDWRLKDGAYLDIYGYLIGVGIGATALFVLSL